MRPLTKNVLMTMLMEHTGRRELQKKMLRSQRLRVSRSGGKIFTAISAECLFLKKYGIIPLTDMDVPCAINARREKKMKIIKVSTELELSVHEFPPGNYAQQNGAFRKLIGNGCDIYEHVMPNRLYTELQMKNQPTRVPGQCVSVLVDGEGLLKENKPNLLGSYLYEADKHGNLIMGNILFVGEKWGEEGIDFCGIEDAVLEILEQKLKKLAILLNVAKVVEELMKGVDVL